MKHLVLFLLLLGLSSPSYTQNTNTKDISGSITYLNKPLKDVNIKIKGISKGTKTDEKGNYTLQANIGDHIQYSYVGFDTVTIMIEDVTSILNIEMDNYVTKLDEVVIDGTSKTRKSAPGDEYNRKIKTSMGNINPMLLPGARYFSPDRLQKQYRTLSDALKLYFPKGLDSTVTSFELDGKVFPFEPYVDVSTIRDIYYVGGTTMIIRTTNSEEYREITAEKYRNQIYYDEDAIVSDDTKTFSSSNLTKDISGKVTYLGAAIPNVNITIKGTSKGTKTDDKGEYSLQANIGDILEYSHLSYKTVAVMVEDVTSTLNIELQEKDNQLDEVVVKARIERDDAFKYNNKKGGPIMTAVGIVNPENFTGSLLYFDKNDHLERYDSFSEFWSQMYKGTKRSLPGTWDVDGIIYHQEPAINFNRLIDIHVIKGGATKWGTMGGVVIVRTLDSPFIIAKQQEEKAEQYRNQNYYNDNAVATNSESTFSSSNLTKDISGKVTYLGAAIPNVNITIKGTSKGTKTDDKGEYSLQANIGDILEYSHLSYKTVAVMIEDVTSTLNIELQEKDNQLEEVVVKARVDQKAVEYEKRQDVDLQTPFGTLNPRKSGFAINHLPGEEISDGAPSLVYALAGKFAGLSLSGIYPNEKLMIRGSKATYVIDGMTYDDQPPIPLSSIRDIFVLKQKAMVIIVTDSSPQAIGAKTKDIAKQYQNQNYYNADAVTASDKATFSSSNIKTSQPKYIVSKDIHGKVTYLDAPMPLVNISVVGKNAGVTTSPKGEYTITANVGDIIQYSYVGFATVSIVVEDVTEVLDIEMVEKQNELETVVVTTDGKQGKTAELAKKAGQKFTTAMGTYDPKTSGNSSAYIEGYDTGTGDILDMLSGKVAGVTVNRENNTVKLRNSGSILNEVPPIWDVDGVITSSIPQVDPSNIKDIHLLKSLAATTRYGTSGRGGVIVVTTKSGDFSAAASNRNKIAEKYTNKDYYANDASQISLASLNANSYADALEAFPTKQKAYIYYEEKLKNQLPNYADHIAIAQKFVSHFNDLTLSTQIFKELMERYAKNPEILKAIAFHLQTVGRTKEAIDAYERTFKLRPHYAQSYRDLANAYMENDQFKKAWRLYMSYLLQGNDVSSEGIGQLIYNEMEWLYFSRRNQTDIKENFVPQSENLFDFRNDVRIVVEWNSSEAEFDLEFVNPDLRSYVFEHSLAGNQDLITDEKQKGYSSKEFFIDKLEEGEWLVNFTYKGNKKPEPTYFKITKFYNWGKSTQTKEVAVYKFQNEREKIQLMRFNKALLVAKN